MATRLTNGDSDLGGVLEDVRNMSDDVPEGDAMDGWMSCILYVEGRDLTQAGSVRFAQK